MTKIPAIKDVSILVDNKVVEVTFEDKTKEKAVRYANELFKNKNCLCIQVDLNDEFGVIETVFEKTR